MNMNSIRKMVSGNKKRFVTDNFNLDLSYITPNIIAMGYPAESIESLYRNKIDDVITFLNSNHRDKYFVYNLCSEKGYDPEKFGGRAACYPFTDHQPPIFSYMIDFCKDVEDWFSRDPHHVVVVHCKAGKGRTGLMICCYLLYSKQQPDAASVLEFYGERRTRDANGVTIPSQKRYISYFSDFVSQGLNYKPVKLYLSSLLLTGMPSVGGGAASHVYYIQFILRQPSGEVFQSPDYEIENGTKQINLKVDSQVIICGDVKFELYIKVKVAKQKINREHFLFFFNTFFINSDEVVEVTSVKQQQQPPSVKGQSKKGGTSAVSSKLSSAGSRSNSSSNNESTMKKSITPTSNTTTTQNSFIISDNMNFSSSSSNAALDEAAALLLRRRHYSVPQPQQARQQQTTTDNNRSNKNNKKCKNNKNSTSFTASRQNCQIISESIQSSLNLSSSTIMPLTSTHNTTIPNSKPQQTPTTTTLTDGGGATTISELDEAAIQLQNVQKAPPSSLSSPFSVSAVQQHHPTGAAEERRYTPQRHVSCRTTSTSSSNGGTTSVLPSSHHVVFDEASSSSSSSCIPLVTTSTSLIVTSSSSTAAPTSECCCTSNTNTADLSSKTPFLAYSTTSTATNSPSTSSGKMKSSSGHAGDPSTTSTTSATVTEIPGTPVSLRLTKSEIDLIHKSDKFPKDFSLSLLLIRPRDQSDAHKYAPTPHRPNSIYSDYTRFIARKGSEERMANSGGGGVGSVGNHFDSVSAASAVSNNSNKYGGGVVTVNGGGYGVNGLVSSYLNGFYATEPPRLSSLSHSAAFSLGGP